MKLMSALQNRYSDRHDQKLRKFENRCLDDSLLKWAAKHLDYLDQPEIDQIARAVALLPDPPGVTVTQLVDTSGESL